MMRRIFASLLLAAVASSAGAFGWKNRNYGEPVAPTPAAPIYYMTKTAISSDVGIRQMLAYSTDLTKLYIGGSSTVRQKNPSTYATITQNSGGANTGLPTDHLGGADTLDDNLYVAANKYVSCSGGSSDPYLLIYAPTTGLPRLAAHSLAGLISPNPSAVGIDPATRTAYFVDYCNPSSVFVFTLPALATDPPVQGASISPQSGFTHFQGIAIRNSLLYITGNRITNPVKLNSIAVFNLSGVLQAEYVLQEFPASQYEVEDIAFLSDTTFAVIFHDDINGGSYIAYYTKP